MSVSTNSVSIIIATFNRRNFLRNVLNCLNAQSTERHFEVIIADDGSTDGTAAMIHEYMEKDLFCFSLLFCNTKKTNIFGASIARNQAIQLSTGKYLLFLDDDCLPHPSWVEMHVSSLEAGADVVIGNTTYDVSVLKKKLPIAEMDKDMKRLEANAKENNLTEFLTGNASIQKTCIDRCGLFDERFAREEGYGYEDIEFGHRLLIGGYSMCFNRNAVVCTERKDGAVLEQRAENRQKAKKLWWHVLTHPQKGLPITPALENYAVEMKKQLEKMA